MALIYLHPYGSTYQIHTMLPTINIVSLFVYSLFVGRLKFLRLRHAGLWDDYCVTNWTEMEGNSRHLM